MSFQGPGMKPPSPRFPLHARETRIPTKSPGWGRIAIVFGSLPADNPPSVRRRFHACPRRQHLNYNGSIMSDRVSPRATARLLAAGLLVSLSFAQTAKRPLNHKDYDGWRTIASQHLSADGKFLAYGRVSAGRRRRSGGPQPGHRPGHAFSRRRASAASRRGHRRRTGAGGARRHHRVLLGQQVRGLLHLPLEGRHRQGAEGEKTADQMPKDGMAIVELASGKAATIRARAALHAAREGRRLPGLPEGSAGAAGRRLPGRRATPGRQRRRRSAGRPRRSWRPRRRRGQRAARAEFGSDLVLRALADGAERTFTDVAEFHFTDDGKQLVYAVAARDTAKNGVFAARPGSRRRARGAARRQGQIFQADLRREPDASGFPERPRRRRRQTAQWKIYRWDRQAPPPRSWCPARRRASSAEFAISDKGTLAFSRDGSRLFFGVRRRPPPEKKPTTPPMPPSDEKGRGGPVELQRRVPPARAEGARRPRPRPHLHRRLPDSRAQTGATRRRRDGERHRLRRAPNG